MAAPSSDQFAKMLDAVGKSKTALTTLKAKNKKLKEEKEEIQEEVKLLTKDNATLRERVALLESQLQSITQSASGNADSLDDDCEMEIHREEDGVAINSSLVEDDDEVDEMEGAETGIELEEDIEEDHEEDCEREEKEEEEEEAEIINGASARYGDAQAKEGGLSSSDAPNEEVESKSETASVNERCAYFFSAAYTGAMEDTRSVAAALGACSPARVARALHEGMRQVPGDTPDPRLMKIRNIVSLLKVISTLTLRIDFRQFMLFKPGKPRTALKKASPASVPGILYLRELLACVRERAVSEWMHHLNSVSFQRDAKGGKGGESSSCSHFVKTMLQAHGADGEQKQEQEQEEGRAGEVGIRDTEEAVDRLRHILGGTETSFVAERSVPSRGAGAVVRAMSAVYVLGSLSVGQVGQVRQYLETLLLLESTPRSGNMHNWPLLGALSAVGLAASSFSVFGVALLHSSTTQLLSSDLAQRFRSYVALVDASQNDEDGLLRLCATCTSLQMPTVTAAAAAGAAERAGASARLDFQAACRRRGFLPSLSVPLAPYEDSALDGLAALLLRQDRPSGEQTIRFLLGPPIVAEVGAHPLVTLCKWLGPLPTLSPREDQPLREALVDAFEEAWGPRLPSSSSSSSAAASGKEELLRSAREFGRWKDLLHCFSAYEYDPDPTSARCYSRARAPPVTGRLDNPGFGWRVAPDQGMPPREGSNECGMNNGDQQEKEQEQEQERGHGGWALRGYPLRNLLRLQAHAVKRVVREASSAASGAQQTASAHAAIALDASDDEDEGREVPAPPSEPWPVPHTQESPNVPATVRIATMGTLFARCLSSCSTSSFDPVAEAMHLLHRAPVSVQAQPQLAHLRALVSLAVVEALFVLLGASAKGCIAACVRWRSAQSSLDSLPLAVVEAMKSLLGAALEFFQAVPAPWSFPYSVESVRTFVSAHCLLADLDSVLSGGKAHKKRPLFHSHVLAPPHAQYLLEVSGRVPCLTINLARRPDRHMKVTKDACDAGLLPITLNAFDAFAPFVADGTTARAKVGTEGRAGGKLLKFMGDFFASAASARGAAPLIHECVSEKYVSHVWDSTQNNGFDPTCIVNEATPLTPSERCCAASHLAAWLVIQHLREHRANGQSKRQGHGALEEGGGVLGDTLRSCAQAQLAFDLCRAGGGWDPLTPAMGLDDWYLILEDDAVVAPEYREPVRFRRRLTELLVAVPTDWDILYLGHAASSRGKGKALSGGLFCKPSYLWQLHGYVLRGRAVDKLLSLVPIRGPVDNFMASLVFDGSLCAYSLQRQLVVQEGNLLHRMSDSDIDHSGRTTGSDSGQGLSAAWKSLEK
jgi:GR25 family glycosyltransferase involved in LPS biosynthesis